MGEPRLRAWNRRLHFYLGLYFLLFIWLAVLVLIAGWAADFITICRQLLA